MKTIIIVSQHNSNWGAERSTCSIGGYLKSLGFRVIIIIPNEGGIIDIVTEYGFEYRIHYFRGWVNRKGTNYFRAFASSLINVFQLVLLYYKFRKERIKPDFVYSNTLVHGFGILLSKFFKIPHLQHIRENIDVFGMKFNWGYKRTLKIIEQSSEKIVCTCSAIKERYINDIQEEKFAVVYNGIPIKPYVKPTPDTNLFTMVYTGRLYMDKRPQDLLKMIKLLVSSGVTDIRLDIYGEGNMEDELRSYIIENNLEKFIIFKGFQKSIDYSQYYVGFLPSEFEAFARTVLEYMMSGLAVIGTNTGGTKEQVIHGETGYLYKPGNISELEEYLLMLYKKKENCFEFGSNGYHRVVQCFSQNRYLENLSNQFISCI